VDFISKTAAAPGLAGLEISLQGYEVSVRATQESCLEVRAGDRVSRSALPPSDTETLMREELGILDGDPVFDRVLE